MQAVLSFARVSRVVFMMQFGWMRPWIYGLTLLFRPVTQVLFFGIVARFVTGQTDVGYWVIGKKIAWGPFAVALLASVFGTSALGAAVGSLGMYTDAVNIVNNVVASLLLIFSGINYPVSVLPGWLLFAWATRRARRDGTLDLF